MNYCVFVWRIKLVNGETKKIIDLRCQFDDDTIMVEVCRRLNLQKYEITEVRCQNIYGAYAQQYAMQYMESTQYRALSQEEQREFIEHWGLKWNN